jgi:hypothetical protein
VSERVRELNDEFRRTFIGGDVILTNGVRYVVDTFDELKARALFRAVQTFDDFEKGNDPYGEHDFGSILFDGHKFFWKIDYYAKGDMNYGSDDPADPEKTTRVMTIMLAEEY